MWIEIKDTRNMKHLINLEKIIDIEFDDDTDLTMLIFERSAYAPVYIRGNMIPEIKRLGIQCKRIGD